MTVKNATGSSEYPAPSIETYLIERFEVKLPDQVPFVVEYFVGSNVVKISSYDLGRDNSGVLCSIDDLIELVSRLKTIRARGTSPAKSKKTAGSPGTALKILLEHDLAEATKA